MQHARSVKRKVAEPWDLLRGRDVFSEGKALRKSLDESLIRHWAPNCSTFSRARERPIVGVAFSPKPLRDDDNPRGIPSVVLELPPSKRRRLDLDTQIADMAAEDCIASHLAGRYFSLEHPKNSIARRLDPWKELESLQVFFPQNTMHVCLKVAVGVSRKFLFITFQAWFSMLGTCAVAVKFVLAQGFHISHGSLP